MNKYFTGKHFIRKAPVLFLLLLYTASWLCGCSAAHADPSGGATPSDSLTASPSADGNSPGMDPASREEGLFLSMSADGWQDNSLDIYSAVINAPLRFEEAEAPSQHITRYFLNKTQACAYRLSLIETEEGVNTREELATVTDQWEGSSAPLPRTEGAMIRGIGGSVRNNHSLLLCAESPSDRTPQDEQGTGSGSEENYSIYALDEALNRTLLFRTPYLDTKTVAQAHSGEQLMEDKAGRIHIITSQSGHHYYITDPDGSVLYYSGLEHELTPPMLVSLYDDRIAMLSSAGLQCFNPETGRLDTLAATKSSWLSCSLFDRDTLLYATSRGLYTCSLSGENEALLYKWADHGIAPSEIRGLRVGSDRTIKLIYTDSSGGNYLCLKPTAEERKITEIVLATTKHHTDNYLPAVVEFNKKYPAYHIRIEEYKWGDTTLLTKLIAKDGPVLIDTFLTGFEDHADYWEPLDEVMRELDLEDKLIPKALDFGKIDGTLYGIAQDFNIETVITASPEPSSWTYEDFLNCIDANPGLKTYFNCESGDSGILFAREFFMRELADNYLMDAENGATRFDSEEFRKILRLGKVSEDKNGGYEELLDGSMLCHIINIDRPEDISLLRLLFPDGLNYIGFPAQKGSLHYITVDDILTVRASATEEEKRIAHSFFQILLSYDCQRSAAKALNYKLSVRRDVLDAQIASVARGWTPYIMHFPQIVFEEDQLDPEEDGRLLYELIEKAQPRRNLPTELLKILFEELDDYYSGTITEDMLIRNLDSRVGLYLKEQK